MEFDCAQQRFGEAPDIEGLVPNLKKLSLEELTAIPFRVLNELLHTNFPKNANGDEHKLIFDAIQETETEKEMREPVELILRSNGLWIRVCLHGDPQLDAILENKKAEDLAEKFHLDDARITNSLCPGCVQKIKLEAQQVSKIRQAQRRQFSNFLTPTHELPAVARINKTD